MEYLRKAYSNFFKASLTLLEERKAESGLVEQEETTLRYDNAGILRIVKIKRFPFSGLVSICHMELWKLPEAQVLWKEIDNVKKIRPFGEKSFNDQLLFDRYGVSTLREYIKRIRSLHFDEKVFLLLFGEIEDYLLRRRYRVVCLTPVSSLDTDLHEILLSKRLSIRRFTDTELDDMWASKDLLGDAIRANHKEFRFTVATAEYREESSPAYPWLSDILEEQKGSS